MHEPLSDAFTVHRRGKMTQFAQLSKQGLQRGQTIPYWRTMFSVICLVHAVGLGLRRPPSIGE